MENGESAVQDRTLENLTLLLLFLTSWEEKVYSGAISAWREGLDIWGKGTKAD